MRMVMIAVAAAGLAACDRSEDEAPKVETKPAAIAYDGADATDLKALAAHGERLSRVLGCRGCHGKDLQGKPSDGDAAFGTLHPSNLTLAVPRYNDAQLERALRAGYRHDGTALWGMPSEMYTHLSGGDLRALIAYLRTVPPAGRDWPKPVFGPGAKAEIASGELKSAPEYIAAERGVGPTNLGATHALGRYITMTACTECHGARLDGGAKTPDLIVAGGYSAKQFEKLITTGVPVGGRELDLMAKVAKNRLSNLTPQERDALYAYLRARADRPQ